MSKAIETLSHLLTQRGYSPRTSEAYLFWAQKLESHFPGRQAKALQPTDVSAFFNHLQAQRFKSESIRQATSAMRYFAREVLQKPALADAVPKVKEVRLKAKLPSQAEIVKVLNAVEEPQAKLILQLIYGAGLELQEARVLRARSFDFVEDKLRFTSQRTKITRTLPIPAAVAEAAKTHAASKAPAEYMFTAKKNMPLSESTIQRAWSDARTKVRVGEHATIRTLRHCYVRHLEMLGLRLVDVLGNLGIRKDRALAYYAAYHEVQTEMPFSPLDRVVHDDKASELAATEQYVSEARIRQVATLTQPNFDFSRLVALLHELNAASRASSLLSVAFLARAVIDHVPPLFGQQEFSGVANQYPGSKSFKKGMLSLNTALRNIADSYLHEHIRSREEAPQRQQVDFRAQLDQLLGEIVRVHRRRRAA
jgi:site-specific recombinase XerD